MTEAEVRRIDVFFYGLFMDDGILREKGVHPENRRMAFVENFSLVIGARATLVPCPSRTAHGVLFSLTHSEVDTLYSEASVSVYRPEAVSAQLADGSVIPALCFNLPVPPSPFRYASEIRSTCQSSENSLTESACHRAMCPPSNRKRRPNKASSHSSGC